MQNTKAKKIVMTAIIAALYAALTYAQNFLIPGSASAAIQFRVSEVMNVLALFTPYAIPGLTIGCVISNIYGFAMGMPLDMLFGSLATLGATACMYALRNAKIKGYPFLAMLMPAIWNGILVGAEIMLFVDNKFVGFGGFKMAEFLSIGGSVALGELGVMLVLGTLLYYAFVKRGLDKKL
ncbi:MAG: QueT transporter family protein [Ruminococcaceae bacterium]|nr:QueT transporter family protein [Oscillospiraceae bacterium]